MTLLKALRQHISADGVYRAVGETYSDDNADHVKQRVHFGIVEVVEGKGKPKSKHKDDEKADAADDQPKAETAGEQSTGTEAAGLIED